MLEEQPDLYRARDGGPPGGNGSVCRRNGVAYNLVTTGGNTTPAISAGYNYPNNSATCSGSQKCKFTNPVNVNGSPYYYTISQVQYCSAKDAAGWGTTPCVSQWDPTTYKYVRYGTGAATFDPQAFTRVDIKSTGILVNGVSATNPSGRTYAQEMQNFAIWYSFYRTRIQMMQGATGIAFSALDQNSRVGFHTLHEDSLFRNVDFTTANKNTWFTKLYSVDPSGGTNLPDAVWRSASSSRAIWPLPLCRAPPIRSIPSRESASRTSTCCRRTDTGTRRLAYTSRGNNDRTVPSLPNLPGATGFTVGSNFPRPYYEGSTSTSDSVSDLAMYYWIRDLRPGIANKVKDTVAPWQHVTMYGLSIGAPRYRCLPERHRRHHRGHEQLAAGDRRGRAGSRRRPVAWRDQYARQVLQCQQSPRISRKASSARSPTSPIRWARARAWGWAGRSFR